MLNVFCTHSMIHLIRVNQYKMKCYNCKVIWRQKFFTRTSQNILKRTHGYLQNNKGHFLNILWTLVYVLHPVNIKQVRCGLLIRARFSMDHSVYGSLSVRMMIWFQSSICVRTVKMLIMSFLCICEETRIRSEFL